MSDYSCPKCGAEQTAVAENYHDEDEMPCLCYKCGFRFVIEIKLRYLTRCVDHDLLDSPRLSMLLCKNCSYAKRKETA